MVAIFFIDSNDWTNLVSAINGIDAKLDAINIKIDSLMKMGSTMAADLKTEFDNLTQQAAANADAEDAATTALDRLSQLIIDANGVSPQAVADLAAKLKAHADPLAEAIMRDTGTTPPAPPA